MGFLGFNDKSHSSDIVSFSLSNTYKYRYSFGGEERYVPYPTSPPRLPSPGPPPPPFLLKKNVY